MTYTSAANATVLNYAAPVWVALFAWLVFKERLTGLFWLGLVLTLAGVAIVFGSDFLRHPSGGEGRYAGVDIQFLLRGLFSGYAEWAKASGYAIVYLDGRSRQHHHPVDGEFDLETPLTGYPAQTYMRS